MLVRYTHGSARDDWHFGVDYLDDGETTREWMKLNDDVYERKFWFLKPVPDQIRLALGFEINEAKATDLARLFEDEWNDAVYMLWGMFQGCTQEEFDAGINLILGPFAEYSGSGQAPIASLSWNLKSFHFMYGFQTLLKATSGLSGTVRKNVLHELLYNRRTKGPNSEVLVAAIEKFRTDTNEPEIKSILYQLVADNPKQYEKAKTNPNITHWFVGQVMKQKAGKVDAAVVRSLLESILSKGSNQGTAP